MYVLPKSHCCPNRCNFEFNALRLARERDNTDGMPGTEGCIVIKMFGHDLTTIAMRAIRINYRSETNRLHHDGSRSCFAMSANPILLLPVQIAPPITGQSFLKSAKFKITHFFAVFEFILPNTFYIHNWRLYSNKCRSIVIFETMNLALVTSRKAICTLRVVVIV